MLASHVDRRGSEFRFCRFPDPRLLINLDEFIKIRKLLLTSRLESLPHFRSMLPVVLKNWAGVAQFVGSRDNQSGIRFPGQAVDVGRLPRLPIPASSRCQFQSCHYSLSLCRRPLF